MTALTDRLNRFENRLHTLEAELAELRRLAAEDEIALPTPEPEPEPEPEFVWAPPAAERTRPRPRREMDWSFLFGARALAWTGGAVTLLGIVFFFVLAVERGWIGPVARVTLGAVASALCIGAAYAVRRRAGETYASVSAAGVGIAGFYATLLAATALYDLVPRPAALLLAAAIAAAGAALAIVWCSQTLATLGLLGAVLVPVPIALQDGHLSAIGAVFAVIVLGATIAVTIPRGWKPLYCVATVAATLEVLALVLDHQPSATGVAAALWLVSGGGALWLALRGRMTYLPASMIMLSATFAGWSAAILYDGRTEGIAMLVVASAYAAASVALWTRDRDAAAVLWAIALTVAAVAAAVLTSGVTLTIVWALEAAALARLAKRLDEPRFQLASLAWLALAFVHGIGVDAPFSKLFVENDHTWVAALSAAALAAATGVVAFSAAAREQRLGGYALAGASALYAGSLFVVTIPQSWSTGHVLVAILWSAVACALVLARLRHAAIALVAASAALVLGYDLHYVAEPQRWHALAAVAAGALVVAVVDQVDLESFVMLAVAAGFSTASVAELLHGTTRGYGLLGLAAGYGALGVAELPRRRDLASALGIAALALAAPASIILLDGTWLVLAWAATSIALVALARFEERLLYGALAYFGFAFVHILVFEAPPSGLFVAHRHPGTGAPAVLLVLAAAIGIAWRSALLRNVMAWVCGALGVYAATLGILEVFEDAGTGVDTTFQRGHTAVSVLWGVVGLGLLVAGLKRRARSLQIGGFVLFGLSLAKLFLYDLANLSSIARAMSFLGVGALILVGGFFYQRLAATNVDSTA
ncbi:MAG TPA: DUF2339 domain-containing protein [Gaiellaceae bacterium]